MKTKIQKALTVATAVSTLILIVGCQTPGEVVSTEKSTVCPQCETQTVTSSIKGLTYKKHSCPMCKVVVTDEAAVSSALATYTSLDMEEVHICKHCSSIVEPCPLCSAK